MFIARCAFSILSKIYSRVIEKTRPSNNFLNLNCALPNTKRINDLVVYLSLQQNSFECNVNARSNNGFIATYIFSVGVFFQQQLLSHPHSFIGTFTLLPNQALNRTTYFLWGLISYFVNIIKYSSNISV